MHQFSETAQAVVAWSFNACYYEDRTGALNMVEYRKGLDEALLQKRIEEEVAQQVGKTLALGSAGGAGSKMDLS